MPVVTCVCQKCGERFYEKDLYSPVSRNLFKTLKPDKVPVTWDEWCQHISTNCEKCRIQSVPTKCLEDYNKSKSN